jgi:predicted phosphodiesterase
LRILTFADGHVEPDQDLSHFSKLGQFIVDERPDVVIDLGDFVSMSAVSHWDASKKLAMEGRRYQKDIEAGREAIQRLTNPLYELQFKQIAQKKKLYTPRLIHMDGNHEAWVCKYIEQNPVLDGSMDLWKDLGITDHFECLKYKCVYNLGGVNFMHAPIAGNDMPISGMHVASKALQRFSGHVVFGHYHRLEIENVTRIDSRCTRAVSCPMFSNTRPHYLSASTPVNITTGFLMLDIQEGQLPRITEYHMGDI